MPRKDAPAAQRPADCVIKVGDGRGFLVNVPSFGVVVVTAAHCLPHLPPPMPASYTSERTYCDLLGPLGGPASIWAECLFVDPIGDLAVLCEPDGGSLLDECAAYEDFVEGRSMLRVGVLPEENYPAQLLTLERAWERATVGVGTWGGRTLQIRAKSKAYEPGTSGSPVIVDGDCAIAVISVGDTLNPVLVNHLPGWLLHKLLPWSTSP